MDCVKTVRPAGEGSSGPASPAEQTWAGSDAVRTACLKCARKRCKCEHGPATANGYLPCKRCVRRGFECVYLPPKKPGRKGISQENTEIKPKLRVPAKSDGKPESSSATSTPDLGPHAESPAESRYSYTPVSPESVERETLFAGTALDRPLSMFPSSLTFPAEEMTGTLVNVFRAYRAPTYRFLHPSTFAAASRRNPMLISAICLAGLPVCGGDAEIERRSIELQNRFLAYALTSLRAVLDTYMPIGDALLASSINDPSFDEQLDHLCEVVFATCMLDVWASYRGMATLHSQLQDIIVILSFAIGLHRDPPENATYGLDDPVKIFIRKAQRRALWFIVTYFVLFSSHWTRDDISDRVVHYGENRVYCPREAFAFQVASTQPDFDPKMFDPQPDPDLKRPLRRDDLFLFTQFPPGSPERQMRLEITAKMLGDDDTFSWGTYFAYWRLRTDVNQFLKDCVSAGTTPGTLAVIDRMSATISEARLMKRAYNLDMTILDILNNLLPSMKQAESSGDYKGLIDLFQPSHPALDQTGASAHPKAHYLIALRLLRLEVLSDFGLHGFDEIANGAINWGFASPRFWECLREAAIYTKHIYNFITNFPLVRTYGAQGPTVQKVGGLSLAILSHLLSHPEAITNETILLDLKQDVETAIHLLEAFVEGRPAHSVDWVSTTAVVFRKLMTGLGRTAAFKAQFGNDCWLGLGVSGPTISEIKAAHLQQDIVEPEQLL